MDRFASMEVFAKVAEAGSFTAAADALGISGQMAGKQIRMLDDGVSNLWFIEYHLWVDSRSAAFGHGHGDSGHSPKGRGAERRLLYGSRSKRTAR